MFLWCTLCALASGRRCTMAMIISTEPPTTSGHPCTHREPTTYVRTLLYLLWTNLATFRSEIVKYYYFWTGMIDDFEKGVRVLFSCQLSYLVVGTTINYPFQGKFEPYQGKYYTSLNSALFLYPIFACNLSQ